MTLYWPVLKQRLVQLCPTLPGWDGVVVHNGMPRQDKNAKESFSIGWSSLGPEGGTRGSGQGDSGSFDEVEEPITNSRAYTGDITCELVVWGGDESLAATYEQRAFDLLGALEQAIRDDETLGVLPPTSTTGLGAEVISGQGKTGATTRLIVTIHFFVRS